VRLILLFLLLMSAGACVKADDQLPQSQVADPYLDVRTGPGRGYPIFHIVERGAWITLLKQRNQWYKITTPDNKTGWVAEAQLKQTLSPGGEAIELTEAGKSDYQQRSWEFGVLGGRFDGAPSMGLYGGFYFTPNVSTELAIERVMGNFSSSDLLTVRLLNQPFPQWRVSPFFMMGAGFIDTTPSATLVKTEQRNEPLAMVGIGLRSYLTQRFIFRAEYKNHLIFSDEDSTQEITEWKAGFAFFF